MIRCAPAGRTYKAVHMENAAKCMEAAAGAWPLVPTSRTFISVMS